MNIKFWKKKKPVIAKEASETPELSAKEEALQTMRAVRAKFQKENPALLEQIKRAYKKMQAGQAPGSPKPPMQASAPITAAQPEEQDMIPIDKQKNAETVAKFLEMTKSDEIRKAFLKH